MVKRSGVARMVATVLALLAGCGWGRETTPLIGAARNGDIAAIRSLIAHGADPGERGGVNGWPPLMHAVHKNQKAAVAALLDAGADSERAGWRRLDRAHHGRRLRRN
jgi:ankyrin repeat protein